MPHHLLAAFSFKLHTQPEEPGYACVCIVIMPKIVINKSQNGFTMLRIRMASSSTREHLLQKRTKQHSMQEHSYQSEEL
jgi:hypothetical protein